MSNSSPAYSASSSAQINQAAIEWLQSLVATFINIILSDVDTKIDRDYLLFWSEYHEYFYRV